MVLKMDSQSKPLGLKCKTEALTLINAISHLIQPKVSLISFRIRHQEYQDQVLHVNASFKKVPSVRAARERVPFIHPVHNHREAWLLLAHRNRVILCTSDGVAIHFRPGIGYFSPNYQLRPLNRSEAEAAPRERDV